MEILLGNTLPTVWCRLRHPQGAFPGVDSCLAYMFRTSPVTTCLLAVLGIILSRPPLSTRGLRNILSIRHGTLECPTSLRVSPRTTCTPCFLATTWPLAYQQSARSASLRSMTRATAAFAGRPPLYVLTYQFNTRFTLTSWVNLCEAYLETPAANRIYY